MPPQRRSPATGATVGFSWQSFTELDKITLYAILKLRQEIFIVEQHCPYLDCDDLDLKARHLVGWQQTAAGRFPAAYLRLLPPETTADPTSLGDSVVIGRVLTAPSIRHQGVARRLMEEALHYCEQHFPGSPVQLSAQRYLIDFYRSLGFSPSSEEYLEDGIWHLAMTRNQKSEAR
jgi:ElaA protein